MFRVIAFLVAAGVGSVLNPLAAPARLPAPLPSRTLTVPVLMYHRVGRLPAVSGPFSTGLTVQPSVFRAQMEWLKRHGYHAISPQQLFDALEWGRPALPSRPVLITFDDGYRDVLWNAAPVLHRLGMPATAFVITSRISGPDNSFLTWSELRDLEADGFTIGSHTVHHLVLTAVSASQVSAELTQSRQELERRLGLPVDWFAYPAGAEDSTVVQLVQRAGYLLAFTTQTGFTQSAQQPFLLHRDKIQRSDGLSGFAALLQHA